jgi:phenylpyruvate tautomerase PptA (4-oxalocrotonate tautomerase family)
MPLLSISTNQLVQADQCKLVIRTASSLVADLLGKPESYVMVMLNDNANMLFAGSDEPLAYLELKSLGLPENDTGRLSEQLCQLMNSELGVPVDRVYIEFSNPERHMWGWNKGTF